MASLLIYFAHPGLRYSRVNRDMADAVRHRDGVTFVDLYAAYPRSDIDIDAEQERLTTHDAVLFQFPFFWYSVPALIKEWFDLVLEHGFAYGTGGDSLKDKPFLTAITAAGPEEAYREGGYNNFPMRVLLTPLEQTANLCGMRFMAPYVLNAALRAEAAGETGPHVAGYARMVDLIVTDRFDWDAARAADLLRHDTLPALKEH